MTQLQNLEFINVIGLPNLDFSETFGYLGQLPRMDNLAIMNNNLQTLPEEVSEIRSLTKIWMGKNPNLDLRDTFAKLGKLPNLQHMGLGGNLHKALPPEITELKHLVNIWLAGNRLDKLPDMSQMKHLQRVTLNKNQLRWLPDGLETITNLQMLSLNANPDLDLGDAFTRLAKMTHLQILSLQNNQLTALPEEIAHLKKLRKLLLTGNNISEGERGKIVKWLPDTEVVFDRDGN